jgi:hypothetical protein
MGFRFNRFDYKLIYNNPNSKLLEAMCKKHQAMFGFDYFDYLLDALKDIPDDLVISLLKYAPKPDLYHIPKSFLDYQIDVPDFVLDYISKIGSSSYKTCAAYISHNKIPPDIILRCMIENWDDINKRSFMGFLDGKIVHNLPYNKNSLKENSITDIVKNRIAEIEKEKSVKQESFSFKSYFMR